MGLALVRRKTHSRIVHQPGLRYRCEKPVIDLNRQGSFTIVLNLAQRHLAILALGGVDGIGRVVRRKTKLCLLFTSLELSRRQESEGITVTMVDPGPFKSDLVRDVPLVGWFKNLFSSSVDKAAENILYHITSDNLIDKNGKLFKEKQEYPLTE